MDSYGAVMIMLVAVFLVAVPPAYGRKCYVCDSRQNPGCADANQISQLYTDCSTGGGAYGSAYAGGQGFQQVGGIQGSGFGGQPGFPQQLGQQGFGGVGGDRCVKTMIVGQTAQPYVIRSCGGANGMGGDGCFWQGGIQTCTCNWNYCNGSSRLSSASMSAILFAGVATVLSHFYRSSL